MYEANRFWLLVNESVTSHALTIQDLSRISFEVNHREH